MEKGRYLYPSCLATKWFSSILGSSDEPPMTILARDLSLGDIAVFVDPAANSDEILFFAAEAAKAQGARLLGIFVAADLSACECYARGGEAIASMLKTVVLREQRQASSCRDRLLDLATTCGVKASLRIVPSGADAKSRFLTAVLLADFAIAGTCAELPIGWSAEKFMSLSGLPVLAVPPGWRRGASPRHVAIAWKASKGARCAVAAAIHLLRRADTVDIVTIDEDDRHTIDLVIYLARHGIRSNVRMLLPDERPVADRILDDIGETGADLLIMGAYGQARATRLIFGGITERVLRNTPVPVLMSR